MPPFCTAARTVAWKISIFVGTSNSRYNFKKLISIFSFKVMASSIVRLAKTSAIVSALVKEMEIWAEEPWKSTKPIRNNGDQLASKTGTIFNLRREFAQCSATRVSIQVSCVIKIITILCRPIEIPQFCGEAVREGTKICYGNIPIVMIRRIWNLSRWLALILVGIALEFAENYCDIKSPF